MRPSARVLGGPRRSATSPPTRLATSASSAALLPAWTRVDSYLGSHLGLDDPSMDAVLRECAREGLPAIHVAPNQGKLLAILAESIGARRVLEVGTLGGFSTTWLARAVQSRGGRVVSLELNPHFASVARRNLAAVGVAASVEVREGRAEDSLRALAEVEAAEPFDFVFIDADKPSNVAYFEWSLRLTRPGSLIVVDNVVRDGAVVDPDGDASVQGVRRLMERLAREPRVSATALQTVGSKGYDGFVLARVLER